MTFDSLKEIILAAVNANEEKILPDAKLIPDVCADSLDTVELAMALEELSSLVSPVLEIDSLSPPPPKQEARRRTQPIMHVPFLINLSFNPTHCDSFREELLAADKEDEGGEQGHHRPCHQQRITDVLGGRQRLHQKLNSP